MNIYAKIDRLIGDVENTPGSKDKETILKKLDGFNDDEKEVFKQVIKFAYDKGFVYGVKEFEVPEAAPESTLSITELFDILSKLGKGECNGQSPRDIVKTALSGLCFRGQILLSRIIKRDLRCGVGAKTFSKIFGKDIVSVHPYQRCTTFSSKALRNIKFPCQAQIKMDGRYGDIIVREEDVILKSRNGDDCSHLLSDNIKEALLKITNNVVIQGEVLAIGDDGKIMPRDVGNGYLNSSDADPERVVFVAWDIIGLDVFYGEKKSLPYSSRVKHLENLCEDDSISSRIHPVDYTTCNDVNDIKEAFREARENGEEGLILKNIDAIWKNGTSKDQVKVKVAVEGEVEVVGIKEGKGKYAGMVGSLETVSSCGEVVTSVSGMTDKQRKDFFDNPESIVGKVITVMYNDVTSDVRTGKHALYLPRLVEVRSDKSVADHHLTLILQVESFTDIFEIFGG